eukprot:g5531.t1
MKHDDIVGASTATITRCRRINLNHGTLHTFNRFQLYRVDFTPITSNSREESSHRISLSFREFVTWADVATPSRDTIARDTYLRNSLRFWQQLHADRTHSRPHLAPTCTARDILAYRLSSNEELPDRILAFLRTGTHENTKILPVAKTSSFAPIPDTGPTHPRTIALLKGGPDVSIHLQAFPEGIPIDALLQMRGLHGACAYTEVKRSTRFPRLPQTEFCVLMYNPDVPIYKDLSISDITPPSPQFAPPTVLILNQAAIKDRLFRGGRTVGTWGPNARTTDEKKLQSSPLLPRLPTKPRPSNVISILVLDPQDIYGTTNTIHLAKHKLTGAMLSPSPYEYRCVPAEASYGPCMRIGLRGPPPTERPGVNQNPGHQVLHSITSKYGVVTRISTGSPAAAAETPPSKSAARRTLNYTITNPNEPQAPVQWELKPGKRPIDTLMSAPPRATWPPTGAEQTLDSNPRSPQSPANHAAPSLPLSEHGRPPQGEEPPSRTPRTPATPSAVQGGPDDAIPSQTNPSSISPTEPLFSDTSRACPSSGMSGCGYSGEGGNGLVREPRVPGADKITTPSTWTTPPASASTQSGLARPIAPKARTPTNQAAKHTSPRQAQGPSTAHDDGSGITKSSKAGISSISSTEHPSSVTSGAGPSSGMRRLSYSGEGGTGSAKGDGEPSATTSSPQRPLSAWLRTVSDRAATKSLPTYYITRDELLMKKFQPAMITLMDQEELQALDDSDGWLNDTNLTWILGRLAIEAAPKRCLILSSFAYEKIVKKDPEKRIHKWIKPRYTLSDFDHILIPINILKAHWVMVILTREAKKNESPTYKFLDSAPDCTKKAKFDLPAAMQTIIAFFRKVGFLQTTNKAMRDPLAVPQQIGQCDCGVHIVGWTIDFLQSPENFLQGVSSNDSLWFRDQTGTLCMNSRMIRRRLAQLAREDSIAHPLKLQILLMSRPPFL